MSRDIRQTDALVASWRVCAGLFAISLGTVLLEVNLIRLFSFMVWYHFAYLIISVAMLGFGAAGTFLARYPGILSAIWTGCSRLSLSSHRWRCA